MRQSNSQTSIFTTDVTVSLDLSDIDKRTLRECKDGGSLVPDYSSDKLPLSDETVESVTSPTNECSIVELRKIEQGLTHIIESGSCSEIEYEIVVKIVNEVEYMIDQIEDFNESMKDITDKVEYKY